MRDLGSTDAEYVRLATLAELGTQIFPFALLYMLSCVANHYALLFVFLFASS